MNYMEVNSIVARYTISITIGMATVKVLVEEELKNMMKELGTSSTLELILDNVFRMGAKRLVIDSFSALSQAFKEKIDARMVLHLILGRLVRRAGYPVLKLTPIV